MVFIGQKTGRAFATPLGVPRERGIGRRERSEPIKIDSESVEVGNILEIILKRCFSTYLMMVVRRICGKVAG